jgi:hypothetical protein
MICPTSKAKCFFDRVWTTQITLKPLTKLVFARMSFSQAHHEAKQSSLRAENPSVMAGLVPQATRRPAMTS